MRRKMEYRQPYVWLLVIFCIALSLRIWGIWFGLPFSFRADEYHEVFRALELGSGGFNFERTAKGGYFYILFVEYGVLFVALKLAGVVETTADFARYFAKDPSAFYLIGRATTAVFGAINVLLAYRLGARAYSVGAGLLAAIFLSVDFLNVEHSHFITVDVPMTCLATAALFFAVRMVTNGHSRDYKLAALFAALATTTKLPAILLLVPLLLAHYSYVVERGGRAKAVILSRDLWWAFAIFLVTILITNPGYLVNPPLLDAISIGEGADVADYELDADEGLPPARNLYWFYISALAGSLGWPLFAVSTVGVMYALWKRSKVDIMLVSFAFVFYIALASTGSHLYYPRYVLPVIVILALTAGRFLHDIWPAEGAVKQIAAIAVVGFLVALPTYHSVANSHLLTQPDTRMVAKQWFERHIPQRARVFIEGVKIEPTKLTVPLQDTSDNLRRYADFYRTREPGKTKYLGFKLQVLSGPQYDLELIAPSDIGELELEQLKKEGIQYLVVRPESFLGWQKKGARRADFLDKLGNDPDISLIKSFRRDSSSPVGPHIDIYRVDINVPAPADATSGE